MKKILTIITIALGISAFVSCSKPHSTPIKKVSYPNFLEKSYDLGSAD